MNIGTETNCFHDLSSMFLNFGHFSASCFYKLKILIKKSVYKLRIHRREYFKHVFNSNLVTSDACILNMWKSEIGKSPKREH